MVVGQEELEEELEGLEELELENLQGLEEENLKEDVVQKKYIKFDIYFYNENYIINKNVLALFDHDNPELAL